jgi:hypothetical protein
VKRDEFVELMDSLAGAFSKELRPSTLAEWAKEFEWLPQSTFTSIVAEARRELDKFPSLHWVHEQVELRHVTKPGPPAPKLHGLIAVECPWVDGEGRACRTSFTVSRRELNDMAERGGVYRCQGSGCPMSFEARLIVKLEQKGVVAASDFQEHTRQQGG